MENPGQKPGSNPTNTIEEVLYDALRNLDLSTGKYGQAVRQFTEDYGLEKSAVREHFIEVNYQKLKQLMERLLEKMSFAHC